MPIQNDRFIKNGNITTTTYQGILELISSSRLIPGDNYLISDYQTTYWMPNASPPELISCSVEPLVVTAATTSSLFAEAKSSMYPKDIIYYDVDSNQTYCTGSSKGYIYRRIDTKYNNDIGMDFRNVKFRRWQLNITDVWTGSVSYPRGYTVVKSGSNELYTSLTGSNLNNALTTSKWKRFEWDNYQYVGVNPSTWIIGGWGLTSSLAVSSSYEDFYLFSTTPTKTRNEVNWDKVHNNTLVPVNRTTGEQFAGRVMSASLDIIKSLSSTFFYEGKTTGWMNVWLIEGIKNNKCGGGFHNNVIGCAHDNIFGNNFHDNSIGLIAENVCSHDVKYNSIVGSMNNIFSGEFEANFMDGVSYSEFGYGCWANTVANGFFENKVSLLQGNNIGFNFKGNTALTFFDGIKVNNIGDDFMSNICMDKFSGNNIGNSCKYNIFKAEFFNNTLSNNFIYNTVNVNVSATNLTGSTILYSAYSKDIVKNQSGTLKVAWWNTSDVYTSSAITT